jgi:hypothetical protein
MAMEFKPKTEQEVREAGLVPAGEYDFDVLDAEDTLSKARNPMIKVNIGLYVDGQVKNRVFDYLLPAMEAKLRHFCDTVGLLSQYESGRLEAADCVGRSGRAKIGIAPAKDSYAAKNEVKDYVCRPAKPLGGGVEVKSNNPDDSEIPF